jgi:hypothetical protein
MVLAASLCGDDDRHDHAEYEAEEHHAHADVQG